MRSIRPAVAVFAAILGLSLVAAPRSGPAQQAGDFVVHEWGVVTTDDRLDPTPAPPPFVHGAQAVSQQPHEPPPEIDAPRKPIIYFYDHRPIGGLAAVDVQIGLPEAAVAPAVFYPGGEATGPALPGPSELAFPGLHFNLGLGVPGPLPPDAPAWWDACRVPDASPLSTLDGLEGEGFLFYETRLDIPNRPSFQVQQTTQGPILVVSAIDRVRDAVAIQRRGNSVLLATIDTVEPGGRAEAALRGSTPNAIRQCVRTRLLAAGLYGPEVDAFLRVWGESLDGDPAIFLYRLEQPAVDALVPLSIAPEPSSIVRVWLVASPL